MIRMCRHCREAMYRSASSQDKYDSVVSISTFTALVWISDDALENFGEAIVVAVSLVCSVCIYCELFILQASSAFGQRVRSIYINSAIVAHFSTLSLLLLFLKASK